jgi:glycosyltransferase involved in cell wall biosynthesis
MPNVVLEAMAAGKPLVACQVEGVTEILGPLADAQTVPLADASAFIAKLAEILHNPQRAEQLGWANRHRVEQHFSLEKMVRQYDLLYTSLVGAEAPPRKPR